MDSPNDDELAGKDMSAEDLGQVAATHPVRFRAMQFMERLRDHDLAGAWRLTDPLWRRCWAQTWLHPIRGQVEAGGWNADEVVDALTEDDPTSHPLWADFERVQMAEVDEYWAGIASWGAGTPPMLVAPGIEAVVFLHPDVATWEQGSHQAVQYVLMRHDDEGGWRVLNLYSDSFVPEPGWPPQVQ